MIEGKKIRVRLRRYFTEQKLWVMVGTVLEFTEHWLTVEGKGIVIVKGQSTPAEVDQEDRVMMVPSDNIAHIRILPDDFDVDNIRIEMKGVRVFIKVDGAPDSAIAEGGRD